MREYSETIKEDLSHVRWICGPGLCGKTTIARKLASECDIDVYYMDPHWFANFQHAVREEQPCMYELLQLVKNGGSAFDTLLWPQEKKRAFDLCMFHENFYMTIEELRHSKKMLIVLVEGVFPPEKVSEVSPKENAVCIVTTESFYREVEKERMRNPDETARQIVLSMQEWGRAHPNDIGRLVKNNTELWLWIGAHMAKKAREVGIRVITNDGTMNIDELTKMVREHFML